MAQLGGIVMLDPSAEKQKNNFFFGGVDGVKWRKPVVPGDTLVRFRNVLWRRQHSAASVPSRLTELCPVLSSKADALHVMLLTLVLN